VASQRVCGSSTEIGRQGEGAMLTGKRMGGRIFATSAPDEGSSQRALMQTASVRLLVGRQQHCFLP
jgi:hypothetical protein